MRSVFMMASIPVPAITVQGGDAGVAGFAERHEVRLCVCSTTGQRQNMMDLFGGCQFSILLTLFA